MKLILIETPAVYRESYLSNFAVLIHKQYNIKKFMDMNFNCYLKILFKVMANNILNQQRHLLHSKDPALIQKMHHGL